MIAWHVLLVLVFATFSAKAQDFVTVAPSHSKVILENAKVRVIEFRAKAGDKIASHSHPPHIAYGLADGKAIFTFPDGGTRNAAEGRAGRLQRERNPFTGAHHGCSCAHHRAQAIATEETTKSSVRVALACP